MSLRTYKYRILLKENPTPLYGTGYITGHENAIEIQRDTDNKKVFIPWHKIDMITRVKLVHSQIKSEEEAA